MPHYTFDDITRHASFILREKVISCERTAGGMTNYNYKITTPGGSYIYREPGLASELLVSRTAEAGVLEKIAPLAIDADTVFYDVSTGKKITRFVEDRFNLLTDMPYKLSIAAALLKKLHTSGLVFRRRFSAVEMITRYESLMQQYGISFLPDYALARKQVEKLCDYLDRLPGKGASPCHNDPVPENMLLDNNRAYLIDWEYAGMNDHIWDLAAYSLENGLNDAHEQLLLCFYADEAAEWVIDQKLQIYKILQDFLWSLWALIKSFFGADYLAYGSQRYQRACRSLALFAQSGPPAVFPLYHP